MNCRIGIRASSDRAWRALDYLRKISAVDPALVIHGNYLDDEELGFLAEHSQSMAVVYCPRTHAYFGHDRYPLEKMLAAGVSVALGTDSRASSPDLSVLSEMRFLAAEHPAIPPSTVLRLATLSGAKALGCAATTGSLEEGKVADLALVSLPDQDAADPHELLFNSEMPVVATWSPRRANRVAAIGGGSKALPPVVRHLLGAVLDPRIAVATGHLPDASEELWIRRRCQQAHCRQAGLPHPRRR